MDHEPTPAAGFRGRRGGLDALELLHRVRRGQRSREVGEAAEVAVGGWLRQRFRLVERVRVGWAVKRGQGGRVLSAHPLEKVSGDWRAVMVGGRSVLVEVKARPVAERLGWAELEPHQHRALADHQAAGGLSLVAWYGEDAAGPVGLAVVEYALAVQSGWRPHHGLEWAQAQALGLR